VISIEQSIAPHQVILAALRRDGGGTMQHPNHEENLDLYRLALAETADDDERRALFLQIACLLEQHRNPDALRISSE
jgi:hypothetical protein